MTHHNVVVDTEYGPVIVNRHASEFDALAKRGNAGSNHREIMNLCKLIDRAPGMVLDIGASFGMFTLMFARHAELVMSFEPQRWVYNCLCGSIALNDLSNVIPINAAVGDGSLEHGTVPGFDYEQEGGYGSVPLREYATEKSWKGVDQTLIPERDTIVPMVTVDSLGVLPALLKIDVEGTEPAVLAGAAETIARARPVIYVEYLKCDEAALLKMLHAQDYSTYIDGCNYICIPMEKREMFPKIAYEEGP